MGLRLQLRKQQAEAGDIVLLYGDESEALTHPYLARAWAKSGADLRVPAPGQAKKVAMLGSLDNVTRQLIVHTSPTKRSSDFIAHLEQLDRLFGPQPGRQAKPVVLVEDNGPIHTSKRSLAALAARAHWLTVEWLPKYAPELNEIEPVWRDLKAHHLAHQTFTDVNALDLAIHDAVIDLNRERIPDPLPMPKNLCLEQIKAVEAERDALLNAEQTKASAPPPMLLGVRGVGPEFASVLWSEGLSRHFDNRRQVAAYAGLAPTPWQSGSVHREQGISQSGNRRLRTMMI